MAQCCAKNKTAQMREQNQKPNSRQEEQFYEFRIQVLFELKSCPKNYQGRRTTQGSSLAAAMRKQGGELTALRRWP